MTIQGHYARAMASWSAPMAISRFHYSAPEKSIRFTSLPGTYFWSNGSAWGNCTVEKEKAELRVLYGKISLKSFTLEGVDTKKMKEINLKTGQSITILL